MSEQVPIVLQLRHAKPTLALSQSETVASSISPAAIAIMARCVVDIWRVRVPASAVEIDEERSQGRPAGRRTQVADEILSSAIAESP
jgi:hypothetical protein